MIQNALALACGKELTEAEVQEEAGKFEKLIKYKMEWGKDEMAWETLRDNKYFDRYCLVGAGFARFGYSYFRLVFGRSPASVGSELYCFYSAHSISCFSETVS
jgi:hypothetical protein